MNSEKASKVCSYSEVHVILTISIGYKKNSDHKWERQAYILGIIFSTKNYYKQYNLKFYIGYIKSMV